MVGHLGCERSRGRRHRAARRVACNAGVCHFDVVDCAGRPMRKRVERQDPMARALARIIAVADMCELPLALAEAVDMGRQALATRDDKHRHCVLVVGETSGEASDWAARNTIDGGANCVPIFDGVDLSAYLPPLTVVVLPGAGNNDNWPRMAAQIAALGPLADVIRISRRSVAELGALKVADDA